MSYNWLEFARPPLGGSAFYDETPALPPPEHPFLEIIRKAILKYRLKSVSNFAVEVAVLQEPTQVVPSSDLTTPIKIKVSFGTFAKELVRLCQSQVRKGKTTTSVRVREKGKLISLAAFLDKHFHLGDPSHGDYNPMRGWWAANGKTFAWTKLPNEMKDNIIQFCVADQPYQPAYRNHASRQRFRPYDNTSGPFEIFDMLGNWAALLGVSKQVRTITLRLCTQDLLLVAPTHHSFQMSMKRLSKFYQMVEENSVPVNRATKNLARQYNLSPTAHPDLSRYATFRQGVRRICLQMDFPSAFQFFRVMAHGYERRLLPASTFTTHEVFAQMPNLKGILIKLPTAPKRWQDSPRQPGPPLFDSDMPCPRTLHRLIYERAAQVMVPYKRRLMLEGFIDVHEGLRFWKLFGHNTGALPLTTDELESLSGESSGIENTETSSYYPPKCGCQVPCTSVFG